MPRRRGEGRGRGRAWAELAAAGGSGSGSGPCTCDSPQAELALAPGARSPWPRLAGSSASAPPTPASAPWPASPSSSCGRWSTASRGRRRWGDSQVPRGSGGVGAGLWGEGRRSAPEAPGGGHLPGEQEWGVYPKHPCAARASRGPSVLRALALPRAPTSRWGWHPPACQALPPG